MSFSEGFSVLQQLNVNKIIKEQDCLLTFGVSAVMAVVALHVIAKIRGKEIRNPTVFQEKSRREPTSLTERSS